MKALVIERYGPPEEVLQVREIEKPSPKEKEVLVKIHAAAINDYDWGVATGKPYLYRLLFGLRKPKHPVPGMELAGVVEEVGEGVEKLKVGDAVYGDISAHGFGSFAQYISVGESAVMKKPGNMSFEEATAVPHASMLALQALRDKAKMKQGESVLINGAGGGVGMFGLQLAKLSNCEVTGVDTGEKLNTMRSLGFDHVIDYKKENFTRNGLKYDLILDCKSNQSPFAYSRSLKPNGRYVTVGGEISALIKILFLGRLLSLFSSKKLQILSLKPNLGLEYMNELCEKNTIKCVIDGPYTMEDIPKLIRYFAEGKHTGKVVVKMC